MAKRTFDIVVWGATGFTGKWVAKHLFDHYPQDKLSWAIAGRDPDKLDRVRDFIGDTSAQVKGLLADSNDENTLSEMVRATRVVISTVGPYAYYGSLLVELCAKHGTHYVDLTGEVPWMREMIDAHSESAKKSGARIVHTCGFDSIPSDLGVYHAQQVAMKEYAEPLKTLQYTLIKTRGGVSGGTVHSMLNIMKQAVEDKKVRRLLANPYSLNPDPKFKGPDGRDQAGARFNEDLSVWTAPFVMSAINTRVVRRSNALMGFPWGQDFRYSESMATKKGPLGFVAANAIAAGFATFGMVALTGLGRKALAGLLPAQGEGPKVDPDNPGFYIIEFIGETESGKKVQTRIEAEGDPGYGSTSKMLAESAICLAVNDADLPVKGGFWTPASAMGDALIKRLQKKADLDFSVT